MLLVVTEREEEANLLIEIPSVREIEEKTAADSVEIIEEKIDSQIEAQTVIAIGEMTDSLIDPLIASAIEEAIDTQIELQIAMMTEETTDILIEKHASAIEEAAIDTLGIEGKIEATEEKKEATIVMPQIRAHLVEEEIEMEVGTTIRETHIHQEIDDSLLLTGKTRHLEPTGLVETMIDVVGAEEKVGTGMRERSPVQNHMDMTPLWRIKTEKAQQPFGSRVR